MKANELVSAAEKQLVSKIVSTMLLRFGVSGLWAGPLSFTLGLLVGVVVHYGDVLGFMLVDGWVNSELAKDFSGAVVDAHNLSKDATDAEIKQAQDKQIAAFNSLVGFGTPS